MKHRFFSFFVLALLLQSCASSVKLFTKGSGPQAIYNATIVADREHKLLIVPVVINGKTYRFLFDTGAPMVLSKELAAELDGKRLARKPVSDSQGQRSKLDYVELAEIAIAGQQFVGLTAIVVDLKLSPVINCLQIDGLIGANLMRHAFWKIDYQTNELHFTNDSSLFLPDSSSIRLPFTTKATFSPTVAVQLDSVVVGGITFDTGSASGLSIGQSRLPAQSNAKRGAVKSYGYHSSGIFGSLPDSMFYAKYPVSFGDFEVQEMLLSISNTNSKTLLGTAFLEDYSVILNWQKKAVFLNPINPEVTSESVGFGVILEKSKLIVSNIMSGSEAQKTGIAFGDEILEFNNVPCANLTAKGYCSILDQFASKNGPITILVKDKGEFTFEWKNIF